MERSSMKAFVEGDPLLSRFFNVFLFEDLPASDRRPEDVYLKEVDQCAVFVGLLGAAYGEPGVDGRSPMEREFDRATRSHKPRLIFVKNVPEADRHPKARALLRRAGAQLIRRRFGGMPELTAGLYAALVDHLERSGRLHTKPFDASACSEASLTDLLPEKVRWFLGQARRERQYPLRDNMSVTQSLSHLNLLDGRRPTHAAVLLFAREPQKFLISSEVKCMHFHGQEVRKPIPSYQIHRGTLFDLVDQAVDFVMSKVDRSVGTRAEGPQAPVDYELPREVVAEAIVNAVVHRDYTSTASVQVMLFSDRLEVWNPGELPPGLTLAGLRQPHASIPRNPLIAEPFFLAHYAEKAGSGILDMIARCKDVGLRPPRFRQDGGQFVQTIPRPRRPKWAVRNGAQEAQEAQEAQDALSPIEVAALRACDGTPRSGQDIFRAVGYSGRTGNFKRALARLLSLGLIAMTMPDRPTSRRQQYRATEQGRQFLTAQGAAKGTPRAPQKPEGDR